MVAEHRQRSFEPGIMHGDYSYANVMIHDGAPARIAANAAELVHTTTYR